MITACEGNTYELRRLENVLTDVSDRDSGARSIGAVLFWGLFFLRREGCCSVKRCSNLGRRQMQDEMRGVW